MFPMTAGASTILYIIIGLLVLFGNGIEKYLKSKKAQQSRPAIPGNDTEFEETSETGENNPQHPIFEELVRELAQMSKPEPEPIEVRDQPLEVIPDKPEYLVSRLLNMPGTAPTIPEVVPDPYKFNIREAVIASEILNRKY
jgi:hypothetical protein